MPPQLALIICTIFVLFLLHLDHKQSPDVSFAFWIPSIWMLLSATKPLGVWFDMGGGDMQSGSPLDRTVLSIILCLGLLVLIKRGFNWSKAIRENLCLILLGYMLVSILWSDMPYVSFKRWVRQFIAVVMAFIVMTEAEPYQALQCLFRRIVYVLIPLSYILIHYFPKYGRDYARWSGALMWIGVASQKNGLAMLCLFAILYLVWTFIRRRQGKDTPILWYQTYVDIFILLLAIWLFMGPNHTLTNSATSTVALIIGFALLITLVWLKKRNIIISANALTILMAAIIMYGTITPFAGKLMIYDPSAGLGREETLTGRTDIWATLLPYAMRKPILGHGYGGFWTDAMREITSSNAHNGYLDTVLNLGFVGHILFSIFFISSVLKAQREMGRNFDWGALWTCLVIISAVHNIAESTIPSFTSAMMAFLLFFYVLSNIGHYKRDVACREKWSIST